MTLRAGMQVQIKGGQVASRRSFLRGVAAGAGVLGALGWRDLIAAGADTMRRRGKSCILLWMGGGPSQYESFDPKPGHACMGPTKTIATSVPGLEIGADWQHMARVMDEVAVIRSMVGVEPDHPRATYHLHTGYLPNGGVKFPTFGAVAAAELSQARPEDFDLPHFVAVGNDNAPAKKIGSGFLSPAHAPLLVTNAGKMPSFVTPPPGTSPERFARQIDLTRRLEEDYAAAGNQQIVEEHRGLYESARRLVLSPRLKAFDIAKEPTATRARYGDSPFGQGCLLARRLVEQGVPFVEVQSFHPKASAGWDTHKNNFEVTKYLVDWVDPAYAALLTDLKARGLLDDTLVVWMGEFGRTPKINKDTGRDHHQKAFTVALAGAGIQGGRILGATSADGSEVTDRPVSVADLFCTFCHALGIDPRYENETPLGRPIKIVDGGSPVMELFG
jgi:hypothetical protein